VLMQTRWINRGSKHYGLDIVAPAEIVTNVLICNFCYMFAHSDMYWFDYSLFVNGNRSLDATFMALYAICYCMGIVALGILATSPRVDTYFKADSEVVHMRWADHATRNEREDEHLPWYHPGHLLHYITPTQVYLTPKYQEKFDRDEHFRRRNTVTQDGGDPSSVTFHEENGVEVMAVVPSMGDTMGDGKPEKKIIGPPDNNKTAEVIIAV